MAVENENKLSEIIQAFADADLNAKQEKLHYLNSNGEKVDVMNMFYPKR